MKLLFVVHRYAPYPGGSEVYVQNMAEGMKKRGHDVTVLATTNKGDYNDIHVTDDVHQLMLDWDLIIVHGSDVITQDTAHINSEQIKSPILYLLVKPSDSPISIEGMRNANYLGYSTLFDIEHIKKYNHLAKARRVRHGVSVSDTIVKSFMLSNQKRKTFVSVGGFYPHKAMKELAALFKNIDADLYIFGYGMEENAPESTSNVFVQKGKSKELVMRAIASADAYIMHSYEEGFGLVLIEAMMNKTPWIARCVGGAFDMRHYGIVYTSDESLVDVLNTGIYELVDTKKSYDYAMTEHTITATCDDIEDILLEVAKEIYT